MAIDVRWGSATHPGRVREHNEDALLAGPDVFAVADGMGGHAGGHVASALAVAGLARLTGLLDHPDPEAALATGLAQVNDEIRRRAGHDDALRGMGSTVAGIARTGDGGVLVFHLGDSRVYRWRRGDLEQLTDDHSVVGDLLRAGALTDDEAARHPHRSVITRALGVEAAIEPVITRHDVEVDDRFLVTSDGLSNELAAPEIERLLAGSGPVELQARALLDAALAGGGRDNVSVVLVAVTGTSPADGLDADTSPTDGLDVDTSPTDDLDVDTSPTRSAAEPEPEVEPEPEPDLLLGPPPGPAAPHLVPPRRPLITSVPPSTLGASPAADPPPPRREATS